MTRHVTSAIPNVPVVDVRRNLYKIRDLYENRYEKKNSFDVSSIIDTKNNFTIASFTTQFITGMHMKRYQKKKKKK